AEVYNRSYHKSKFRNVLYLCSIRAEWSSHVTYLDASKKFISGCNSSIRIGGLPLYKQLKIQFFSLTFKFPFFRTPFFYFILFYDAFFNQFFEKLVEVGSPDYFVLCHQFNICHSNED